MLTTELSVLLNGQPTAKLVVSKDETELVYLNQNSDFIASTLPPKPEPHIARGLFNLHPFFAGLLPEGITAQILFSSLRIPEDNLVRILQVTGHDAIGDITTQDPTTLYQRQKLIDISDLTPANIVAIPGVQKKTSLGELIYHKSVARSKAVFIRKYPHPDFPGICEQEHIFTQLAAKCHIPSHKTHLHEDCIMLKRFDRIHNPATQRFEQIHVEDALQIANLYPRDKYSLEFHEILTNFMRLTQSPAIIFGALRQFIFNYMIGNGDFHAKNISLIFDRKSRVWSLAPAYDILTTLAYPRLAGFDRTALALHDDAFGKFKRQDFISLAQEYQIPSNSINNLISTLAGNVQKNVVILNSLPELPVPKEEIIRQIQHRAESLRDS